jgi:hypothetical protein
MVKALSDNQIKGLLRHENRRSSVSSPEWPKSGDRKLIYEAAIHHKKTVVLGDGKTYALSYAWRKSIAWTEYDAVFVKPTDGRFAPCGWFRIKALLAGGTNG